MPTMKEIAEALRFAASTYANLQGGTGNISYEFWHKQFKKASELEVQVEQMRCETCQSGDIEGSYICCMNEKSPLYDYTQSIPENFYCSFYEMKFIIKEVKNG